jgi:hypothetical protein
VVPAIVAANDVLVVAETVEGFVGVDGKVDKSMEIEIWDEKKVSEANPDTGEEM